MNQKGFANIAFVILVVVLAGVLGYFVFVKKQEPVTQQPTTNTPSENQQNDLPTPSAPTLIFTQGTKPFVQINFDYSIANFFNIYRSTNITSGWQKIISNFPSNAHTAIDYDYPKETKMLYYRITSVNEQGRESVPSQPASVSIATATDNEIINWKVINAACKTPSAKSHFGPSFDFVYELKLPQGWDVKSPASQDSWATDASSFTGSYKSKSYELRILCGLGNSYQYISLKQALESMDAFSKTVGPGGPTISNVKNITVDNRIAIQREESGTPSEVNENPTVQRNIVTYFFRDGVLVGISLHNTKQEITLVDREFHNKILSTFKFTK